MREKADLSTHSGDVARTVDYGRGRVALKMLGLALLLLGMGGILLYAGNEEMHGGGSLLDAGKDAILGGASLLAGLGLVFLQIRQVASGEPLLRLSPGGARLNIDGRVFVDIPWREVSEVTALDAVGLRTRPTSHFERLFRRRSDGNYFVKTDKISYSGVTALHVSDEFYDRAIKPKLVQVRKATGLFNIRTGAGMTYLVRSPGSAMRSGLGNIFVVRDEERYVLLHHSVLPVSREALRAAVEERWLAFRGKAPAAGK